MWESFVLWFFGSKIKDSYASEVVRQVLSARCNLLPVGFEMTDDDFGNEQAMMPNAAKSIEWPKPTLSELMTLLVWKDMKRHDMCFFMFFHAFCQMLGGYLRRISAKAGKLPNLPRKLLCPFALPGSCVQSSKQRSTKKHECFTKVSSNPLLPMTCPIKSNQFSDSKINGFSFVFWLSTIARSAKQQDRELEPPTWEDGEDDRQPCRRKKPNLQGYGPPSEVPNFFHFRFEVSCIGSGNGGLKIPQRKWRIYDLWMKLKWKSLGEFVKPCGLEEAWHGCGKNLQVLSLKQ